MIVENSNELVEIEKINGEKGVVRKYQRVCWGLLFQNCKSVNAIIDELRKKYLPSSVDIIVLETNTTEEIIRVLRDRLEFSDYDISIKLKDKIPFP